MIGSTARGGHKHTTTEETEEKTDINVTTKTIDVVATMMIEAKEGEMITTRIKDLTTSININQETTGRLNTKTTDSEITLLYLQVLQRMVGTTLILREKEVLFEGTKTLEIEAAIKEQPEAHLEEITILTV